MDGDDDEDGDDDDDNDVSRSLTTNGEERKASATALGLVDSWSARFASTELERSVVVIEAGPAFILPDVVVAVDNDDDDDAAAESFFNKSCFSRLICCANLTSKELPVMTETMSDLSADCCAMLNVATARKNKLEDEDDDAASIVS